MTDTSAKHPVQWFALAQRAFCAKKTSRGSLTVKVQQVCTALALHHMDLRRELVAGRQELFGMLERVQRLCTAHNIISPSALDAAASSDYNTNQTKGFRAGHRRRHMCSQTWCCRLVSANQTLQFLQQNGSRWMFPGFFATHRACGEVLLKNVAENYLCKFLALRMQESVRQLHT